ncbi:SsgA family sporulation/cell division regulator [Streptacidiphilus sp. PAMC 29251]
MSTLESRMTLTYNSRHPLQITAAFEAAMAVDGRPAQWIIGRDLIADGLLAPAGLGDIRIHPDGESTAFELHAGPDYALVTVATDDLTQFLDATCALVPLGSESPAINWRALTGLLQRP